MDVNTLFDVKDKTVLVTGGAKGIGLMISTGFVANGAHVYIASRDAGSCARAAADLTARGPGTATALPADLLQHSECERLASELKKSLDARHGGGEGKGRLNVLVNNSGAAWGAPLDDFPDAQWARILTLNLTRVFTLTQMLLPVLEPQQQSSSGSGGGSADTHGPSTVINIGSIDALRPPAMDNYSYSASKAGLHHLSRVLSQKLGPRGITVNTLACGPFDTKMMAFALRTMRDAIEEGNPLGRIGRPEDAAGACIFLASRAGSYVNGATINVDGGVHLSAKM